MPSFTFLAADTPLAKSYRLDPQGKLVKESYPHVAEFTSHTEEYETLQELSVGIQRAANAGWCLLKGELQRKLVSESRAGSTDQNSMTRWVCLDFDRLPMGVTIEQAMNYLGLGHISHITQYSASQGIEHNRGDTGHVFLLLTDEQHPAALKQWLISLNLRTECLRSRLELTKTNNAISWPLDISTCQNDKLLYLAPPILASGIAPFAGDRIVLAERSTQYLDPGTLYIPSAEENRNAMNKALDALRAQRGLPERKWATQIHKGSGLEVLTKPDRATMTGLRSERGFTYFNLNGGDSWGYYHPDDSPEIIRNFKGEPYYTTKELLPEYWAQRQARLAETGTPDSTAPVILAFRDFRTAVYYNGTWNPKTQGLELAKANSVEQLQHYLLENNRPKLESIPIWTLAYEPKNEARVDLANKRVNMFEPTVYMKQEVKKSLSMDGFPLIRRIIEHAVSREEVTLDHFLNWVACIFTKRLRTQTSWVLHGVQGTGKGLLVNKVLIPLLGMNNVAVRRMADIEDRFNGFMEFASLVVVDEAKISDSRISSMLMANLKNMITEPEISVRKMFAQAYNVPNYCNFMFLSNETTPVHIETSDRRHNVGEYRKEKLGITDEEVASIINELPAFANYLHSREANEQQARTVLITKDRAEIMAASTNSIETTAQAILNGNLEFFWDALPAGDPGLLGPEQQALFESYQYLVRSALKEPEHKVTRDELRTLFAYNIGDVPRTPAKFTLFLSHHRITLEPIWRDNKPVRGMTIYWKAPEEWLKQRLEETERPKPILRNISCKQ